jgi:hypothetical protein
MTKRYSSMAAGSEKTGVVSPARMAAAEKPVKASRR